MERAVGKPAERLAARREDLYLPGGPDGFDIVCVTGNSDMPHSHIYMENYAFTPDSRRFLIRRREAFSPPGTPKDQVKSKMEIFVCDMDDGYSVRQLTDEENVNTLCNVSPDGRYALYFVGLTDRPGYLLKRANIETGAREVIMAVDKPLSGLSYVPTGTAQMGVRVDGLAVCTQSVMHNPGWNDPLHLTVVLDIEKGEARAVIEGNEPLHHHQYAKDPASMNDIMVQHNHMSYPSPIGSCGADIHVIKDDGTDFRDFPWGRDGWEQCMGHQCYLAATGYAVTSTIEQLKGGDRRVCHLIASKPMDCAYGEHHTGLRLPGAIDNRVVLTRDYEYPCFCHFGFDPTGVYGASDWIVDGIFADGKNCTPEEHAARDLVYIGRIVSQSGPGIGPGARFISKPVCRAGAVFADQSTHPHAALSPDHRTLIFNTGGPGEPPQAVVARVSEDMFGA